MSLFAELKRRNVFRVAVAAAVAAWLATEVASVVLPTFGAPDWVLKALITLLLIGFPIALLFAWVYCAGGIPLLLHRVESVRSEALRMS